MDPIRETLLWASQNRTLREHLPRYPFVRATVSRFMPGEDAEDALAAAQRLALDGIPVTFTRLGENVEDLAQAQDATERYLRLMDRIDELGLDAEISVKLTHLGFDLDPAGASANMERLAERARGPGTTVWIDMESSAYVEATVDLYRSLLPRSPNTGICLQAYLRRTWTDVQRLLPLGPSIRFVKGAYREPPELAFQDRRVIDESYFRLATHVLPEAARDEPDVRLALATHDTGLIERIERFAAERGVARDRFEVQMLYGIRTDEQLRLARAGYRVRTLIAFGPLWYPWFMRRLAEKPSNVLLAARNLVPQRPTAP